MAYRTDARSQRQPALQQLRNLILQARQLMSLGMMFEAGERLDYIRSMVATLSASEQAEIRQDIDVLQAQIDPLGLELWR